MATKKKAKKAAKKAKPAPAKRAAKRAKAAPAKRTATKARAAAPKSRSAARPAKKAAPRGKARAAAKPTKARPTPAVRRRDRPGHIDPAYAEDLRNKAGGHEPEPVGFVERPRSKDDLVEELGEEVVSEATGAEHKGEEVFDQEVPEERGGPFVESTAGQEFALGTDPSNPKSATREPFPRT
jgi:hypothetical protein